MLTLGSKAKYGNHDCIVVGRTIRRIPATTCCSPHHAGSN